MALVKPNLQTRSENYIAKLQRRNATFQDNFRSFLNHDKRKLLVIEMGSTLLSVLNVLQILSDLEENLKTRYGGGANSIFLSWGQLVADIGGSKVIPQFPNIVVLEFDKSAMDEQDMKVLKKIGERLSMGPSWKKVVLVASEKGRLNNVLQELQSDMFGFLEEPTYKNIPELTKSLYEACVIGDLDAVEAFIENGADIDQLDGFRGSALHIAAECGRKKIVSKLLKNGAKHLRNEQGDTAIHLAANRGHVDIVMLLLQDGVDVNIVGNCGYSPLHYASESGRKEVVLTLLQHGAKHLQDYSGETPLYLAARAGHSDTVIGLLEYGADVNDVENNGATPLHVASLIGHHDIVRTLILYDANIHATDNSGWTALHYAAFWKNKTVVNTLLEFGAEVDNKATDGVTPLHLAAHYGDLEIVKLLIEIGNANLNCKATDGVTPLHLAAENRNLEVVKLLIEIGNANLNYKTTDGVTPLHLAAHNGNLEVVKLLIEIGNANLNCKDNKGKTPLDWAKERQHTETVEYLTSKGAT